MLLIEHRLTTDKSLINHFLIKKLQLKEKMKSKKYLILLLPLKRKTKSMILWRHKMISKTIIMRILKFMFEKLPHLQFTLRANQRILKIHLILKTRRIIIINEEAIIIHSLTGMVMDELTQWMNLTMIVLQNWKIHSLKILKISERFLEELLSHST